MRTELDYKKKIEKAEIARDNSTESYGVKRVDFTLNVL